MQRNTVALFILSLALLVVGSAAAKSNSRIEAKPKAGLKMAKIEKAEKRLTVGTLKDNDGKEITIQCQGQDDCVAVLGAQTVQIDVQFEVDPQGNITNLHLDGNTVRGSFHKGPFVAGSEVRSWPLDGHGQPFGAATVTSTTDDRGVYSLVTWSRGGVLVEGHGLAYDEATGTLSSSPITLRAVVPGDAAVGHVNALTHIAAQRTRQLMGQGLAVHEAVAQADAELARALPVAVPHASAGMVLGGEGHDELLEISAILTSHARGDDRAGSLQALLDAFAADLADDGRLEPTHEALLVDRQRGLDLDAIEAAFDHHYGR